MPDLDAKTWGLIGAALFAGAALALVLKPILRPCGCQEQGE